MNKIMWHRFKTFLSRLQRFSKSLLWHLSLGLPKSSQNTIDYRFAICVSCDRYNKEYSQCLECGCNLSNKSQLLNKLAWADQECPLGKWKSEI